MLLKDRVAIITGGARGIGRGIALKFADEGCSIAIADVRMAESKKTLAKILKKGREGLAIQCDVADSLNVHNMVDKVISKFGKVDILVNSAGIGPSPNSIADIPEDEWDKVLAVNLKGVFLCCKAVVPHMKEKRYGKIVNISSGAAISPPASLVHYTASKAGVLGMTYDMALELAPFSITVNTILPGPIRTEFWGNVVPPGKEDEFFTDFGKRLVPMQRVGTPEDIAGAALFLASDLSVFVTGEYINVGGGQPLHYQF
ncbi:MAG: SDR family oxidoreductase [Dehalococcoidia bacterium]|nr:SDR family oxidoreductase [Dehalococcoidia bacterium]